MAIQKVGVVGCGLMGVGNRASVRASRIPDGGARSQPRVGGKRAEEHRQESGAAGGERHDLTEAAKSEIRGRLKGTTSLEDLKDCDVIVEAIIEQLAGETRAFCGARRALPAHPRFLPAILLR